jgi:hypothetical protein
MNDSRAGFGSLYMPRTRGALSGLLLIALGFWGALVPFVGPYFDFAYTPGHEWTWTTARGWLEVLPGVATVVGGLLLVGSVNRATAMFGGWLAAIAGAWFVVGGAFAPTLGIGDPGHPVASTDTKRAVLEVCYFSGLGAVIVFLGGAVLTTVAIQHARDVKPAPAAPGVSTAGVAPAPEYTPAPAPEASPDATTQERIPGPPGRRSKGRFFGRNRADAGQ